MNTPVDSLQFKLLKALTDIDHAIDDAIEDGNCTCDIQEARDLFMRFLCTYESLLTPLENEQRKELQCCFCLRIEHMKARMNRLLRRMNSNAA